MGDFSNETLFWSISSNQSKYISARYLLTDVLHLVVKEIIANKLNYRKARYQIKVPIPVMEFQRIIFPCWYHAKFKLSLTCLTPHYDKSRSTTSISEFTRRRSCTSSLSCLDSKAKFTYTSRVISTTSGISYETLERNVERATVSDAHCLVVNRHEYQLAVLFIDVLWRSCVNNKERKVMGMAWTEHQRMPSMCRYTRRTARSTDLVEDFITSVFIWHCDRQRLYPYNPKKNYTIIYFL